MLTVVLGLGSALGYALHDFLMVKVVRAAAVWTALVWSMGVGLAILLPLALVLDGPPSGSAEWRAAAFAVASGLCEAAALACLLRGLVTGNLSIVTPLASLAGGFVAVIAVIGGESLSTAALIGLPLAVAGGLLASVEKAPAEEVFGPDERGARRQGDPPPLATVAAPAPARRASGVVAARSRRAARRAPAGPCSRRSCSRSSCSCSPRPCALHPVAIAAYGRLGTMVVLRAGGAAARRPAAAASAGRPMRRRRGVRRRGVRRASPRRSRSARWRSPPWSSSQGGTMAVLLGYLAAARAALAAAVRRAWPAPASPVTLLAIG